MNNNIFKAIVDSDVQSEVAANALRAAIVEMIIYNTSVQQRVDENYYSVMVEAAKKFIKAKKITMVIGTSKDEFTFYGKEALKNLQKLFVKLTDFKSYYEDSDCYISDTEVRFSGFCWKFDYNARSTKCGLYYEETTDDEETEIKFDCEGEECEW